MAGKVSRSATVRRMTIALLVCSSLVINAKPGLEAIEAGAIAAHVRFLADDLLEGRGTGERGHAVAARYVASQMEVLGLRAAGDAGTWLQEVLLRNVHAPAGAPARDVRSHNVAGLLPQTEGDSREVLVVSAHLDHLGIGDPVNGDAIYNGAVDNATGIAEMLEIARAMAAQRSRKRGVLFLAVTGEELGLLGSAWFVKNPTVPLAEVVADLNLDQLSPMWKPHDVVLRGAEQSTLEEHVRAAATALGLSISADPVPEQNFFFRSDQYNFARAGVPAACLWQGFKDDKGGDSNGDIFRRWRSTRYHHPDDDLSQPFDWEAAASWARFEFLVGYSVVQGARPKWKKE